jgi:hypothetical protein
MDRKTKQVREEMQIPDHTCPLINAVQAELVKAKALAGPGTPVWLLLEPLNEQLEEIRNANLQLRFVGKRFKKLANSFRYWVVRRQYLDRNSPVSEN